MKVYVLVYGPGKTPIGIFWTREEAEEMKVLLARDPIEIEEFPVRGKCPWCAP